MASRAQNLITSGWAGVYYFAGGGTGFLPELLTTPGASNACLNAAIPYAQAALSKLLGGQPQSACSSDTARALAMSGFIEAQQLGGADVFALACTASLRTTKNKRGEHRVYVAVQTPTETHVSQLVLEKNRLSRTEEEALVVEFCWACLDQALEVELPNKSLLATNYQSATADSFIQKLVSGDINKYCSSNHQGSALLPGAFNPLHAGHQKMKIFASDKLGQEVAFELSVTNVDKPPLDYLTIEHRAAQFSTPLWLTSLPTFREKAHYFPNCTFVVGIDTLMRIDQPGYYANEHDRDMALRELAEHNSRFLVFGRDIDGTFTQLEDIKLSSALVCLCESVTDSEFRHDISSTQLREER